MNIDPTSAFTGAGIMAGIVAIIAAIAGKNWRHVVNFLLRRAIKKNPEFVHQINILAGEGGEALVSFSESVAGDGKIDAMEAKKIEMEVGDVKKAIRNVRKKKKPANKSGKKADA